MASIYLRITSASHFDVSFQKEVLVAYLWFRLLWQAVVALERGDYWIVDVMSTMSVCSGLLCCAWVCRPSLLDQRAISVLSSWLVSHSGWGCRLNCLYWNMSAFTQWVNSAFRMDHSGRRWSMLRWLLYLWATDLLNTTMKCFSLFARIVIMIGIRLVLRLSSLAWGASIAF